MRKMAKDASNSHQFITLDGMRGVAALAVVVFHCHTLFPHINAPRGYLAVDFFFMLSGFVIAHAYGQKIAAGMTLLQFLQIRFVRLYPLYIICTFVTAFLVFTPSIVKGEQDYSLVSFLVSAGLSVLMLPTPFQILPKYFLMPMNVPTWSLFYELLFNGFMLIAWKNLRLSILLAAILVSALALIWSSEVYGTLDVGHTWPTMFGGVSRLSFAFFVGILLCRLARPAPRYSNFSWFVVLLIVPVFLVDFTWMDVWFDLFCCFVWFPLVIWLGILFEPIHSSLFRFLGQISYPAYVVQSAFIISAEIIRRYISDFFYENEIVIFLLFMACIVFVSYTLQRWFDSPVRRWIRQMQCKVKTSPSNGQRRGAGC